MLYRCLCDGRTRRKDCSLGRIYPFYCDHTLRIRSGRVTSAPGFLLGLIVGCLLQIIMRERTDIENEGFKPSETTSTRTERKKQTCSWNAPCKQNKRSRESSTFSQLHVVFAALSYSFQIKPSGKTFHCSSPSSKLPIFSHSSLTILTLPSSLGTILAGKGLG